MPLTEILAFLLTGVVSGLIAGLLGVGGGAIIVPALIFIFARFGIGGDYAPHLAVGCSLATIIGTSIASTLAHQRHRAVRWDLFRRLTAGILIGAALGAMLAASIPDHWLTRIFALFLAFIGLRALLRSSTSSRSHPLPGTTGLVTAGGVIGSISALLGVGGGIMTVPFLNSRSVNMRHAVGTSAACGLPIALTGTVGFMALGWNHPDLPPLSTGFVYWPAVLMMLLASMPMAQLGARLAHRLPVAVLKRIFGLLLLAVSLRMLTA